MKPSALPPDTPLTTFSRLILACGGQPPDDNGDGASFTGRLLELMQHADPQNLAKLSTGFPDEARAFLHWRVAAPALTASELRAIVTGSVAEAHPQPPERRCHRNYQHPAHLHITSRRVALCPGVVGDLA